MNQQKYLAEITHICAAIAIIAGFAMHIDALKVVGMFALAGSITNSIAIYLIFEKVPGVIGSGVILRRFDAIKLSLNQLVMDNLFGSDTVRYLSDLIKDHAFLPNMPNPNADDEQGDTEVDKLKANADYLADKLFTRLIAAVKKSSLGSLLSVIGGEAALEPIRPHLANEISDLLTEKSGSFANNEKLRELIAVAVAKRIDKLTPKQCSELVAKIIRNYLGWLVVWGGVIGALFGGVFIFSSL